MPLPAALAALVSASFSVALTYAGVRSVRHPRNSPARARRVARAPGERVVVCAGDSITHGAVSFDYVTALHDTLDDPGARLVNGGINGDLAFNLLSRLDDVVACDPDVVTILIGTNDVMGSFVPSLARGQKLVKGLPRTASLAWYEENLRAIVARLQTETRATLILITLPLLGDELDSEAHRFVEEGSAIIRRVAAEHRVALVELTRALEAKQRAAGHVGRPGFRPSLRSTWWTARAPLLHYLGLQRWDAVSDGVALLFTTDLIHLNERSGAELVALLTPALRHALDEASAQTPSA